MAIAVVCPACDRRLGIPENAVGRMVKCPQCANQFVAPAPSQPAASPSKLATGNGANTALWHVARDGQQFGPYTLPQLQQMAKTGQLQPTDHVIQAGGTQWLPANSVKGLFGTTRSSSLKTGGQSATTSTSKAASGPRQTTNRGNPMAQRSGQAASRSAAPWVVVGIVFLLLGGGALAACIYDPFNLFGADKSGSQQVAETSKPTAPVDPPSASKDKTPTANTDQPLSSDGSGPPPTTPPASSLIPGPSGTGGRGVMEFQDRMKEGKAAMVARRYDDAVKAFEAAVSLNPSDQEAQTSLDKARKDRDDLRMALDRLQAALTARDATGANDALSAARMLAATDDPLLQKYEADLKNLSAPGAGILTPPNAGAGQGMDFAARMKAGDDAMAVKQFEDAVKAYQAAVDLNPNDPMARTALQQAQKARDELQRALGRFRAALTAGKLEDAQMALTEAMTLSPTSMEVQQAHSELQKLHETAARMPGQPPAQPTVQPEGTPLPIRLKLWPDNGNGLVRRETRRTSDGKTTQSKEENTTILVMDRGVAKAPTRYAIKFDSASIGDGKTMTPLPHSGRTVQLDQAAGQYIPTALGQPSLGANELTALGKKANDDLRYQMVEMFAAPRPVRVGERWLIDNQLIADTFLQGGELDLLRSRADGKLLRTYDKNGRMFAVVEADMKLAVKSWQGYRFEPPASFNVKATMDGAIDGLGTAMQVTYSGRLSGRTSINQDGKLSPFNLNVEVSGTEDRSDEIVGTDPRLAQIQNELRGPVAGVVPGAGTPGGGIPGVPQDPTIPGVPPVGLPPGGVVNPGMPVGPIVNPGMPIMPPGPAVPLNPKQQAAQVKDLLRTFNMAMQARQYDQAQLALMNAMQIAPNDPKVMQAVQRFQTAQPNRPLRPGRNNLQAAQLRDVLNNFHQAIKLRQYDQAQMALNIAMQIAPQDPRVIQAMQQWQQVQTGMGTRPGTRPRPR